MVRRNISLPDDLDERARRARLNVSALAQRAVARELDRQSRMAQLDAWLDELDATHGAPSAKAMAEATEWFASGRKVEPREGARRPARVKGVRKVQRAAG
jgi:post-segregation antitoxin (ccd killing protein)